MKELEEQKKKLCVSSTVGEWLGTDDTTPLNEVENNFNEAILTAKRLGAELNTDYQGVREKYPALANAIDNYQKIVTGMNKAISIFNQQEAVKKTKSTRSEEVYQKTLNNYTYIATEKPMLVRRIVTVGDDKLEITVTTERWEQIRNIERAMFNKKNRATQREKIRAAKEFIKPPELTLNHG